jgi:NitT/TauT family transport system permease protein
MGLQDSWFAVGVDLPTHRDIPLTAIGFLLVIATWCAVSYVPWIWHPMVRVTDSGDIPHYSRDQLVDRKVFAETNAAAAAAGQRAASGKRANPVFLPAPHQVARALVTAFTTPPKRTGDPWLHESLWHSVQIIFWGFLLSASLGVPLGLICGSFDLFANLSERFVDFVRYMPAPAFGALAVAIFGIEDAPKIAIIFIGTFFPLVLVVANTTRQLDFALLEASQTLGASRWQQMRHVVIPGVLPDLYNDLRILIGCSWTTLIIAELIGASSGISYFIHQQGKYRHYENDWAGIILIGGIGVNTNLVLSVIGEALFPWSGRSNGVLGRWLRNSCAWCWRLPGRMVRSRAAT